MILGIVTKRALRDLKQNIITHAMTTGVVAFSCLMFVIFGLISYNLQHFVEKFGRELAIVVYLKKDVSQEEIPGLYKRISSLEGVESVNFISSEEAYRKLEGFLKDEKEVLKGVDPLFLPPSFEVQIDRAVFNLDRIRRLAQEMGKWSEVSKVQYGQEWVDRLEAFSNVTRNVVLIAGLLLLFTATFVVSNTIKLTVYARQEEIEIMRLVGATNGFIQGPFLIEAFLQGFTGAAIAIMVSWAIYNYISEVVRQTPLLKDLDLLFLPWTYVALVLAASSIFCVFGTFLALRRFLKL